MIFQKPSLIICKNINAVVAFFIILTLLSLIICRVTIINFSIEQDSQGTLLVNSDSLWTQDSFPSLTEGFLQKYQEFQKLEFVIGADRASLRFCWQTHFFYLQFECCIETMWVEPCDLISKQQLIALADYMRRCH